MDNSFKIWSLTMIILLVSSCGDGHRADYSLDATKDYVEKKASLEERAAAGDANARGLLKQEAFERRLGFNDKTGRDYLDALAKDGDRDAARQLNLMNRGQPW